MAEVHGTLTAVTERTMGDELAADYASGATVLTLTDVSDLDEAGGLVTINGTVYTYTAVDMDLETITLKSPGLTAGALTGDRVDAYDPNTGQPVVARTALVLIDGQDDGDPVEADLDHSLVPLLPQNIAAAGQSVTLGTSGGGHQVTGVLGKRAAATITQTPTGFFLGQDPGDGTIRGLFMDSGSTFLNGPVIVSGISSGFAPVLASAVTLVNPTGTLTLNATLTSGSGAPTASGTKGDIYFRTDTPTTANQRIYINSSATTGTTWTGIV